MDRQLFHYAIVTASYWAFTITDGAIRMLVVLYFHQLGYSPFEVAMLFLFYELFGVITNLVGGWLGARIGLNRTMLLGMALQVFALAMLMVPDGWLSVIYVMAAQALSGIAKDLNKMSAKASVKTLTRDNESGLFRWVAILTGSKNALKGAGFFVGAALLEWIGFRTALGTLAGSLAVVMVIAAILLPGGIGRMASKPKFSQVFSNLPAINRLSAARFFLFASRDVWFVVGLPVFLYDVLGWGYVAIGSFMALWVIGYGIVQASTPGFIRNRSPQGSSARNLALLLALCPAAIAWSLGQPWNPELVITVGLVAFAVIFAFNSAVHSYLILAYSDFDKVSLSVGFYYMANAGGRLLGTVLSGICYQLYGLTGCLYVAAVLVIVAALLSIGLPAPKSRNPEKLAESG